MEITMRMDPYDLTYLKESFNKNLENLLFRQQVIRVPNPNPINFNNMQERINALDVETYNIQTITDIISDLIDMRYNTESLIIRSPLISNYELSLFDFFIETLQYDETYDQINQVKNMLDEFIKILNTDDLNNYTDGLNNYSDDLRLINLNTINVYLLNEKLGLENDEMENNETIQTVFYNVLQQLMFHFKDALNNYNVPDVPDEPDVPPRQGGSRKRRQNQHRSKRKSIKRKIMKKRKYGKKIRKRL